MTGGTALNGRHGIVGFVPNDALDHLTQTIVIEVVIKVEGQKPISVGVRTNLPELQERLRSTSAEGLRAWFHELACTQISLTNPALASRITDQGKIYWVCPASERREPFLRY